MDFLKNESAPIKFLIWDSPHRCETPAVRPYRQFELCVHAPLPTISPLEMERQSPWTLTIFLDLKDLYKHHMAPFYRILSTSFPIISLGKNSFCCAFGADNVKKSSKPWNFIFLRKVIAIE